MILPAAIVEFEQALESARSLMALEVELFSDPPDPAHHSVVQGLRGGASVLMVASLEQLLRQGVEEHLTRLADSGTAVKLASLPDRTRIHNAYSSFEIAMKGQRFGPRREKLERLIDIENAARRLLSGTVDPSAFSDIGGNPSSERIRAIFKTLDFDDIFVSVEKPFIHKWGSAVARTFIPDNLDAIVQRRHQVAHTASALAVARVDLEEGIKFIDILGHLLNDALDQCVSAWLGSSSPPPD